MISFCVTKFDATQRPFGWHLPPILRTDPPDLSDGLKATGNKKTQRGASLWAGCRIMSKEPGAKAARAVPDRRPARKIRGVSAG